MKPPQVHLRKYERGRSGSRRSREGAGAVKRKGGKRLRSPAVGSTLGTRGFKIWALEEWRSNA